MPIMPTMPLHQGCVNSQSIASSASSCLLQIFVPHQPVRFAIAAHIHAHAGITMAGHVGMGELIAGRGAVALPVAIFQNGRNCPIGIGRQPDARAR
jgi:hypothetical protein